MPRSGSGASTNWNSIKFSAAAVALAVLAGCAVAVPLTIGTPAKAPSDLEVACASDRKCRDGTAEYRVTSSRSHSATGGKVTTAFAAPANAKVQRFTTASVTPPNAEVQKIDVSAMTCRQFLQASEGNIQCACRCSAPCRLRGEKKVATGSHREARRGRTDLTLSRLSPPAS